MARNKVPVIYVAGKTRHTKSMWQEKIVRIHVVRQVSRNHMAGNKVSGNHVEGNQVSYKCTWKRVYQKCDDIRETVSHGKPSGSPMVRY